MKNHQKFAGNLFILSIAALLLTGFSGMFAQPMLHPKIKLLDENGVSVLSSGGAMSTLKSCSGCHDAGFIETHSFHSNLGLDALTKPGQIAGGREWDFSDGAFGKWNAIAYRYLSPSGDAQIDMGTADWVRYFGARHVGGGPAKLSRSGEPLTELVIVANDPETHIVDPETGALQPWDWQKSGVVEMNCFLCHTENPNNAARVAELQSGNFRWANTATLLGTGIVQKSGDTWRWNAAAFDADGFLAAGLSQMQSPTDANCGLCHGQVHADIQSPLTTAGAQPEQWSTQTTGQIFSPQRMFESGVNLSGKKDLSRPWDVHAERLVACVDCHYSINNPVYYQESATTRPAHLKFDSRRMAIKEYLYRPSHQFAKGETVQETGSAGMRRCESCHNSSATHDWLPYKERHLDAISCESCHIPKLFAPAGRAYDWTVLTSSGKPRIEYRGIDGQPGSVNTLITGYEPVLLPRRDVDDNLRLSPHNLITFWYWVQGDPERPVRLDDLKTAFFSGDKYHPEILSALDENKDGNLGETELVLNTPQKIAAIQNRLTAAGVEHPRIRGDVEPFGIHHNVANFEWVTRECTACHSSESRLYQPMLLSAHSPDGVTPQFVNATNLAIGGKILNDTNGQLIYRPQPRNGGLFVLGHDVVSWSNYAGMIAFMLVLLGIAVHGGSRVIAAKRHPNHVAETKKVYIYHAYERFWHWLQAIAIIVLILTGLVIHSPDTYHLFDFALVVQVHNIVGFILLANAFLAAFYHIAGGEIRQYLPEPRGFFSQAIAQTYYYMYGIFKNAPHPFEKTERNKLNPLQRITYLIILNILLPLQIISGILIWGAQRWPEVSASLGGLGFLVPLHSFAAWLFAAFLIMHIYLTTTGHTPMSNIRAMVVGWEDVEIQKNEEVK